MRMTQQLCLLFLASGQTNWMLFILVASFIQCQGRIKMSGWIADYPLSGGGFESSVFWSLSFLNSNFPNFQVKLSPIERKGIVRI